MLVTDVPVAALDSYPTEFVQLAAVAGAASKERVLGVCQVLENYAEVVNAVAPEASAESYLARFEHRNAVIDGAKITLDQAPLHGSFKPMGDGAYDYIPNSRTYEGRDRASFVVEAGNLKIRVVYAFHVLTHGASTPETDNKLCGKNGTMWKISLPTAPDSGANLQALLTQSHLSR